MSNKFSAFSELTSLLNSSTVPSGLRDKILDLAVRIAKEGELKTSCYQKEGESLCACWSRAKGTRPLRKA